MVLSWGLIGIIIGLLLGLTGAGGAVVAVPLFVYLTHMTIRDATVLSLITVLIGAILNWLVQIKNTHFLIGFSIFTFSTLGSILFKPLKAQSPDWVLMVLFVFVALMSLVLVWLPESRKLVPEYNAISPAKGLIKSSLGGFCLGVLVTMTGLGGGVAIVPFLVQVFHLTLKRAAATSLLIILLSSLFSLWMQSDLVLKYLQILPVLALFSGSVISALITKKVVYEFSEKKLNQIRKFLITIIILFSVGSLLLLFTGLRTG